MVGIVGGLILLHWEGGNRPAYTKLEELPLYPSTQLLPTYQNSLFCFPRGHCPFCLTSDKPVRGKRTAQGWPGLSLPSSWASLQEPINPWLCACGKLGEWGIWEECSWLERGLTGLHTGTLRVVTTLRCCLPSRGSFSSSLCL